MSTNGQSAALAVVAQPQTLARAVDGPLHFTEEQRSMIRNTYARGATEAEFEVLLEIARVRRLNPLLKQIHFVKRKNRKENTETWTPQVSIDGMRAIAQRTGLYDGQDEPEIVYDDKGNILKCTVRVYRKDWTRPAVGVAHFSEYAQRWPDGNLQDFWKRMPHVMIAKCAEAIAIRKAFPEDTSGLYVPEEMPQVDREESDSESRTADGKHRVTDDGEVVDEEPKSAPKLPELKAKMLTALATIKGKKGVHAWQTDVMKIGFAESDLKELNQALQSRIGVLKAEAEKAKAAKSKGDSADEGSE